MLRSRTATRLTASLAVALCFVATGCDDQDNVDDTEPPEYREVAAVFEASGCATESCHGGPNVQGELSMDTPDYWVQLIDVECANSDADEAGYLRVKPGDPDASFLMTKLALEGIDPELGLPMPPSGDRLTEDELDLVRRWIEAGAAPPAE